MRSFLLALVASALLACASAPPPPPTPAPVVEAPSDPLDAPGVRPFAQAYQRIFCKANYGYDPEATLETLRKPIHYMQHLAEGRSDILVGYLQILETHGFPSLGAFADRAAQLREDRELWGLLQARCLDGLSTCQ